MHPMAECVVSSLNGTCEWMMLGYGDANPELQTLVATQMCWLSRDSLLF